jgi:hypothetical protein
MRAFKCAARIESVEYAISVHRTEHLSISEADPIAATHHDSVDVRGSCYCLFAALRAHSVAFLGFGADSGIELVSAFVVFLRFKNISHIDEKRAARINGLLLFALAAFILGSSFLAFTNPRFRPEPSYLGIVGQNRLSWAAGNSYRLLFDVENSDRAAF